MLHLADTDLLEIITSASCDLDVVASYTDRDSGGTTFTPGITPTNITTATTTTIVAAPAASSVRRVQGVFIRNAHATTAVDVTVEVNRSAGTLRELVKTTLLAGETLEFVEGLGFFSFSPALTGASQAEQEAGTATNRYVSPANQHFHPSGVKAWGKSGIAGNLLGSYNITSVTDTGTGALTVTIANDFSSTNYSLTATIELASTTLAQSCTYDSVAAGSFLLRSVVEAGSAADPVTWSWQCCGDL
jgi:hypothetical protein